MRTLLLFLIALSMSPIGPGAVAGDDSSRHRPSSSDRHYDVKQKEDIASIERRRVAALVNADMNTASRLHAPDFQLINPLGGALSKDEYLSGIESGFLDYLVWQPGEISVRRNGRTAVLRYQSELQIVIAGETQPLGRYWHTDYYEKRGGRWQVVWSHATAIPE